MTILFEALIAVEYASSGAGAVVFSHDGRAVAVGVGDSIGTSLLLFSHSGASEVFDSGVVDPPIPSLGVGALQFGQSGQSFSVEYGQGAGQLEFSHRGAHIAANSSMGRGHLQFSHVGMPLMDGAAYAYLAAPPSGVTAYAGFDFAATTDSIAAAGADTTLPIHRVRDRASLAESRAGRIITAAAVIDALMLGAETALVLYDLVVDLVAFDSSAQANYTAVARAVDRALVSGAVSSYAEAVALVLDAMVLAEVGSTLDFESTTDTITLRETLTSTYLAMAEALDRILASAEATSSQHMTVLLRDTTHLAGTPATEAEAHALVRESVGLSMHLSLDTGDYVAWVVNTEGRGVSTYANYPFNSFAKLGGRYYGATSEGVFLLEGDDDDGAAINARIRLGLTDMNTRKLKRLPEAYIGYKSDGNLLLRVIVTDDRLGEKVALEYLMRPRPAVALRESRFEPGRGVKAVDWDFEFENINGADFDLAEVEFHPLIMDRRTRG